MKILLVEDHERLADVTRRALVDDGYVVDTAADGEAALTLAEVNEYDMIILDVMLPLLSGLEVCRAIRENDSDIPIIMLTARDSLEDRIAGLDTGADDYLVKPFSIEELSARVRALLRRGKKADTTVLRAGRLALDPAKKNVTFDEVPMNLTAKEFTLLQYLMKHSGRVISKNELLEHVWDMNYEGLSNVVETYIRYLRQKIRAAGGPPATIQTLRNLGYKLSP